MKYQPLINIKRKWEVYFYQNVINIPFEAEKRLRNRPICPIIVYSIWALSHSYIGDLEP
jgi:hypothetical protein